MLSPISEGAANTERCGTKRACSRKKQNVFDDFIAAAEYLRKREINNVDPEARDLRRYRTEGCWSGAVMTQRPDLFGAALPAVGVMDMLRFNKFHDRMGVDVGLRIAR